MPLFIKTITLIYIENYFLCSMNKLNTTLVATLLLFGILWAACNNENNEAPIKNTDDSLNTQAPTTNNDSVVNTDDFADETVNEATAEKLRTFLREYLKDDMATMPAEERRFSFYETDLNDDNKNEYFIKLPESKYCGSGGCTFLLVGNDMKRINRFTVTRAPIYIEREKKNGWKILVVAGRQKDKFVHLEWDAKAGKYPSNPTVVEESDLAPSAHDYVMWHDEFSKAKEFTF